MRPLSHLFRDFLQLGHATGDIGAATVYLEPATGRDRCVKAQLALLFGPAELLEPATGRDRCVRGYVPPPGADGPPAASNPRTAFGVVGGRPAGGGLIDVTLVNAGPARRRSCPAGGAAGLCRDAVRPRAQATPHHAASSSTTSTRRPPSSRPGSGPGSSPATAARSGPAAPAWSGRATSSRPRSSSIEAAELVHRDRGARPSRSRSSSIEAAELGRPMARRLAQATPPQAAAACGGTARG